MQLRTVSNDIVKSAFAKRNHESGPQNGQQRTVVTNWFFLTFLNSWTSKPQLVPLATIAILVFIVSYVFIRSSREDFCLKTVSVIETVQGFQGLVLDSSGTASLMISLIEKQSSLFVEKIEMKRGSQTLLSMEFSSQRRTPTLQPSLRIKTKTGTGEVDFQIIQPATDILWPFAFALVTWLFGALALAITSLNKKRHEEKLIIEQREIVSQQVAHDIRSPLAALSMVASRIQSLPELERNLIQSAIRRISDIANNLSRKRTSTATSFGLQSEVKEKQILKKMQDWLSKKTARLLLSKSKRTITRIGQPESRPPVLVAEAIRSIVSEKREQFRKSLASEGSGQLQLEFEIEVKTQNTFISIDSTELRRVLSNLINNAIEAIEEKGKVAISCKLLPNLGLAIEISDNGKGIAPEILSKLTQRGATFGKANGSGIGLFHARQTIEKHGGQLSIRSELGEGTCVSLTLPVSSTPAWFADHVDLSNASEIVIIDDDESVHRLWDAALAQKNCSIVHLTSVPEATEYLSSQKQLWSESVKKPILFIDYEIGSSSVTGFDLIAKYQLAKLSFLVTSHFENEVLQERCVGTGLKMIPKGSLSFLDLKA